MSNTTKLNLLDFDPFGAGILAFNQMARTMDGVLHTDVQGTFTNPLDANVGDMGPGVVFRCDSSPNGAWAGHANELAIGAETISQPDISTWNIVSAWTFVAPIEGFILWLVSGRGTFSSGGWNTPTLVVDTTGMSEANTVIQFNGLLQNLREHGVIAT